MDLGCGSLPLRNPLSACSKSGIVPSNAKNLSVTSRLINSFKAWATNFDFSVIPENFMAFSIKSSSNVIVVLMHQNSHHLMRS